MKDVKKSEFIRSTVFVSIGLMISLMLIILFSRVVTGISAKMTYDTTLEVKKNMLHEYVNNMTVFLDDARDDYLAEHPDATEEEIEKEMIALAHEKIYMEEHSDGAYMWVQKVLDYNGGDDYAIRLIHPNLSDTEGCYLTTNEVNQMGMKAYEIELEGIKKDGEIYQNYAFKKLDSDEVTEKVTYAKLYKPYDWIICMGVNLDDVEHYRLKAAENMMSYQNLVLSAVGLTWLVLILFMLYIYKRTGIDRVEKKNKELRNRLNTDAMTGACSRTYGERLIKEEYDAFLNGKKNTLLLMMDVDKFKQFNDGFGHEVGDKVLISFVKAIRDCIRQTDSIIRWGGDEFIVMMHDISEDMLETVADKLLQSVRNIRIEELSEDMHISTSIGVSYFESSDEDYKDIVTRADAALYKAKESGRNNWKL
jgi:diguanylate cyclase (GGDEF)-like protein